MVKAKINKLIEDGANERKFEFEAQGYNDDPYWATTDGAREFEVPFPLHTDLDVYKCVIGRLKSLREKGRASGAGLHIRFVQRSRRYYLLPVNPEPDPSPSYEKRKPETSIEYAVLWGALRAYCAKLEATRKNHQIDEFFQTYFDGLFGLHFEERVSLERRSIRDYEEKQQRDGGMSKEQREEQREAERQRQRERQRLRRKEQRQKRERLIQGLKEQGLEEKELEAREPEARDTKAREVEERNGYNSEPWSIGGSSRGEVERRRCLSVPIEEDDEK